MKLLKRFVGLSQNLQNYDFVAHTDAAMRGSF